MNRKQYHVWITIRVSGGDEKAVSDDIMRVQDTWNCIRDRSGRDTYDILVVNGEWQVLLTPSYNMMHYEKVRPQLEEILGRDAIQAQLVER